jgi:hypothetical protein
MRLRAGRTVKRRIADALNGFAAGALERPPVFAKSYDGRTAQSTESRGGYSASILDLAWERSVSALPNSPGVPHLWFAKYPKA